MYTEQVQRNRESYFELARQGVFLHRLQGHYNPPNSLWTIEAACVGPLSREQAKMPVERYLKEAYRASGITFMRKSSHQEHQFYVAFYRGDL